MLVNRNFLSSLDFTSDEITELYRLFTLINTHNTAYLTVNELYQIESLQQNPLTKSVFRTFTGTDQDETGLLSFYKFSSK